MMLFEVACTLLLEAMEDAGDDLDTMRACLETYQKMSLFTGTPARSEEELIAEAAPYVSKLTDEEKKRVIGLEEGFLKDGLGASHMKEKARLEIDMLRGGRLYGGF